MLMANAVSQLAMRTPGKEAVAIEAFAKALRAVRIFYWMHTRVIHGKSNFKCLISSSHILFITVIKYIMQNFSSFEKSLEGATSVSYFVQKVNGIFEIKMFPASLSHL